MRTDSRFRVVRAIGSSGLLLTMGLVVAACSQGAPTFSEPETFVVDEGGNVGFEGQGSLDRLSAEDRAAYQADHEYVRRLHPQGVAVKLNHADERQHRFAINRLKMSGKTPENSPQLFAALEEIRKQDIARQSGDSPAPKALLASNRENAHYLGSVNLTGATSMEVVGVGSMKDTVYYGYIDAAAWDKNGVQLGNSTYAEVYSNMPYKGVKSTGNLAMTTLKEFVGDSYMVVDNALTGYEETYITQGTSSGPTITPNVTAPKDIVAMDNIALVCLSRGGTNCDYSMLGELELKLPLQGSVTISGGTYQFDEAKINEYKAGTAKFPPDPNIPGSVETPDPGGYIRVTLQNTGGSCSQNKKTNYNLAMQAFWATVTLSADKKTLTWNMPPNAPANFGNGCQLIQDNVELNLLATLPHVNGNGVKGVRALNVGNGPSLTNKLVPSIRITNSCFAAGTLVEMGSGWQMPIEDVQMGDQISNPFDTSDYSLNVTDTILGEEKSPMVRIRDERGRSLLITENHPIDVPGRGMVMAKYLEVGNQVTTKEGPSRLVAVTREPYAGTVYNLKLGSTAELQSLGKDETTLYANGFLVGDAQVQGRHESAELAAQTKAGPIPSRWRKDYASSAKR